TNPLVVRDALLDSRELRLELLDPPLDVRAGCGDLSSSCGERTKRGRDANGDVHGPSPRLLTLWARSRERLASGGQAWRSADLPCVAPLFNLQIVRRVAAQGAVGAAIDWNSPQPVGLPVEVVD